MVVDTRLMVQLAQAYLQTNAGSVDASTLATVRRTMSRELGPARAQSMSTEALVELVVSQVNQASAADMAGGAQNTVSESKPRTPLDDERAAQAARTEQVEKEKPEPEKTYITIELKDRNGQPIAGEGYKIVLSDGSVHEGTLDADGKATVEDIDPGRARITFTADERPQTWLEIALTDDNGRPLPGEKFTLDLPDGSQLEGYLDGQGRARIENLDPGDATLAFTDEAPRHGTLTVQLADEDGNPIGGEKYRVILPGGREINGLLDDAGQAELKNVDAAEAQVTFFDAAKKPNVSIQLKDSDGVPIGGEKYKLKLPNETEIEGTLDANGMVTVRHIDWGTSEISFGEDDGEEETEAENDTS